MSSTAGEYGAGRILIDALNACVWAENPDFLSAWEATGPDGYPLPGGSPSPRSASNHFQANHI